ncbi:MAG: hypothetical protein JNM62_05870 [Flavobacteriales bacterium]|nr:hypothetical protein [Flavobacteriales bacterium]
MLFIPLEGIVPPLSWAALLVDTFSRAVQFLAARKLFGDRTAFWFALWSICSAPLMLPWATVDFGLHALMSFAPFMLISAAQRSEGSRFVLGMLCGGLASLAYDVWVFAPAFMAWEIAKNATWRVGLRRILLFVAGASLAFLPHLLLRAFVDHGFGLEQLSVLSVRGLEKGDIDPLALPQKAWAVISGALPGSFTLERMDQWNWRLAASVVLLFMLLGSAGALRLQDERSRARGLVILTLFMFLLAVIIGPFFEPRADGHGYLYYRYFPFIAPLFALLLLDGFAHYRPLAFVLRTGWVLGCTALAAIYMWGMQPYRTTNDEATGWVLGRKYGDDPTLLFRIIGRAEADQRSALVYGAGWGLTAALFDRREPSDERALLRFEELWAQVPSTEKPMMRKGVLRAFDAGITPVLDPAFSPLLSSATER